MDIILDIFITVKKNVHTNLRFCGNKTASIFPETGDSLLERQDKGTLLTLLALQGNLRRGENTQGPSNASNNRAMMYTWIPSLWVRSAVGTQQMTASVQPWIQLLQAYSKANVH
jgi:hypothetical protein